MVNQALSVQALAPVVLADTSQGATKDFSNAHVATGAIVDVGAYGANTTNLNVQIEECATTNGTFTLIPGMVCTVTTSNQHVVLRGLRTHRYCRANAKTVQGTTPAVAVGVVIIAERKYAGAGGGYDRSPST